MMRSRALLSTLPKPAGEPFQHYAPGHALRKPIQEKIAFFRKNITEIPCIVNGVEIFTGDTGNQVAPSDHAVVLAKYHNATPEVIQDAIKVSLEAKKEWEATPFEHRAMVFRKAADLISGKYRVDLLAAVMLGTGKNVWQAEIDAAVESADFFRLNTTYAEQIYAGQPTLNSPNTWNRSEYRALDGYVAAISPFNFCAIGANLAGSPALMGNTVLWKPASTAVLGNYLIFKILEEAGLPPGVINFLPSSGKVFGDNAIPHREFAGLHFTGSTATFNHIWRQIASNLGTLYKGYPRIVGETGGKNFHFIHPTADLDTAVNQTIRGAFEYQGQKCSATSRLYVPKSMWPEFKTKLLKGISEIKMGQPEDFEVFMTAVIDDKSFKNVKSFIDHAKQDDSCEIIAGGNCDDSRGYFIEPTVVLTTDPRTKTMSEEIFGPVLTAFVYDDDKVDETLDIVDTTSPYALTGAIFARDTRAIVHLSKKLSNAAGNFYINDKSTGAVVGEQPFGGARASGTNDKAGSYLNLLRWVSARTIKENTVPLDDFKYPSMQK